MTICLELGVSDVKIQPASSDKPLEEGKTNQLIRLILDVEQFLHSLERKGDPLQRVFGGEKCGRKISPLPDHSL